ncbi:hypothetical protein AB0N05_09655 [Nocardia sp. NPDC051030]|uniref:hypothetical protein n=1 Tax=Nocardia sp. NPDC051030 TaxID=3155162 RepID=UPI00342ADE24
MSTVLGLSACGSDAKEPKHAKTSQTSVTQTNYPPTPTVDQLNAEFQTVLDPNVPNEQKLEFMQGVSADPTLPQRLADIYKQNNATVVVTGVTDLGNGTVTADAQASIGGGQPQQVVVPFVAEGGKWKVQKEWICNTLSLGNQTSPACS